MARCFLCPPCWPYGNRVLPDRGRLGGRHGHLFLYLRELHGGGPRRVLRRRPRTDRKIQSEYNALKQKAEADTLKGMRGDGGAIDKVVSQYSKKRGG